MPVTLQWDTPENAALRLEFQGQWTWQDVHQSLLELPHMVKNAAPFTIHVIVDLRSMENIPLGTFKNLQQIIRNRHQQVGIAVIVGANPFAISLWNAFVKLHPVDASQQSVHFAPSLKYAREFLHSCVSS